MKRDFPTHEQKLAISSLLQIPAPVDAIRFIYKEGEMSLAEARAWMDGFVCGSIHGKDERIRRADGDHEVAKVTRPSDL